MASTSSRGIGGLRNAYLDPASVGCLDPVRARSCHDPKFLGAMQRLPNGSTLINKSAAGRALEVTPAGEIVWQFHNPERGSDRDQYIATPPEVLRLPADFTARQIRTSVHDTSTNSASAINRTPVVNPAGS
jgi:hypothetical protein